jgi:hypothetical protein
VSLADKLYCKTISISCFFINFDLEHSMKPDKHKKAATRDYKRKHGLDKDKDVAQASEEKIESNSYRFHESSSEDEEDIETRELLALIEGGIIIGPTYLF